MRAAQPQLKRSGALCSSSPLAPAISAPRHGHRSRAARLASRSHPTDRAGTHERGVEFHSGSSFYRWESAQGRDLAVLAAAVYKAQQGQLRVLEVMAGSGVRSSRYLQQAAADLVWCNDANPATRQDATHNITSALRSIAAQGSDEAHLPPELSSGSWEAVGIKPRTPGPAATQWSVQPSGSNAPVVGRLSHIEATRLLASCFLAEDYYDLIDIDSFGSDASCLPGALQALRFGGMLYLTSTDGFSSGGRRPERSLAAYGTYLKALPFANEQGLRMLIGAAVKEGAAKGLVVEPLFSLYSFHGPVFRVMLRVTQGAGWGPERYSFVGHCFKHSQSYRVGWEHLSSAWCRCQGADSSSSSSSSTPRPLVLSGPMWTGALHDAPFVASMAAAAQQRGWTGLGLEEGVGGAKVTKKPNSVKPLEQLLEIMQEEADRRLPPWFVPVDGIGRRAGACPSRPKLIAALRDRGFAASRCHLEDNAIRTNASMADILQACQHDLGIAPKQAASATPSAAS